MGLMALKIPPGIHKNGTDYQQSGVWNDSNLIRWYEGSLQPIGGWRKRTSSAMTGACRKIVSYHDNSGNRRTVAGTSSKLYAIDEANVVHDITPVGLTAGSDNAAQNLGWGALTWGLSSWGTSRPDKGPYVPATSWSIDNWGEYAIGCSNADGKIYQWTNNSSTPAALLTNAPINNTAIITTDERFVFALGAGGEASRVEWCDQENNNVWTATATNQAGGFTLTTAGKILTAEQLRGETLILTTTDAHVARYSGPPFVYGFQRVGTGCGIASANACVKADGFAIWMGSNAFYIYDGGVKTIPSTVGDFVFNNINESQRSKVYGVLNSKFSEVVWFYPSNNSLENDSYVTYNYKERFWTVGSLVRTAGVDVGEFVYPNYVDADGYIYEHEVGFDYDNATVFAESGPVEIGSGDRVVVAKNLIPDEKTQGDVTAIFKTKSYPNATETEHGPYSLSNPTSVRFQGRQLSMRVTGNRSADWRVGVMRLDVVPGSVR